MSVFELEKIREVLSKYDRGDLSNYNSNTLCAIRALRIMGKLCEEGRKLEAENAALKKHCEWLEQNLNLKNTVVDDLRNQLQDALERC